MMNEDESIFIIREPREPRKEGRELEKLMTWNTHAERK